MNLPRLIIADEIKTGTVPPAVILVYALKRIGINVKVFTCIRNESHIRLLKLLLEEPIVNLDPYTCGSVKNLKTLFQRVASPDVLNVILVPFGTKEDDVFIQVNSDLTDLVKAFSCGVVVMPFASASTVLTCSAVTNLISSLENACEGCVLGVIFASVKNPREYQLLEQDFGRRTHVLSLGYLPKEIERTMPLMHDMYAGGGGIMQVKSAALQLVSASYHVEWQILGAFGTLKKDWTSPEFVSFFAKNFKAAIVGDKVLSLECNNSRELFKFLGCETIDYNPWQDPFPNDAEAIYFPHSIAGLYGDKLLTHGPFVRGIKQSLVANKLIFVNGASAPLFGQYYTMPDGQKYDGLAFFKYHSSYSDTDAESVSQRIEIRGTADSVFCKHDEKMRGYAPSYLHTGNPANIVPSVLAYREIRKDVELGSSGWVKGYCFVTDLHIELWSNVELVNRWLSLRKR